MQHSIQVFGDSHSNFLFGEVSEVKVNWLGPMTMHRVGRDAAHFLDDASLNPEQIAIFVFGEIDARCHVGRISEQTGQDRSEIAKDLVSRYLSAIKRKCIAKPFILSVPPPADGPGIINADFPVFGSWQDRVHITRTINDELRNQSARFGVGFIEIPPGFENSIGGLEPKLSDGSVHISRNHRAPVLQIAAEVVGRAFIEEASAPTSLISASEEPQEDLATPFVEQHWDIPLETAQGQNNATLFRRPEGLRCISSEGQWSYCLVLPIPAAVRESDEKLIFTFDAEVIGGALGVGVVEKDGSTYLTEEIFRPGDLDIAIVVPKSRVSNAHMIVLRNTANNPIKTEFKLSSVLISTTNVADASSLAQVTRMPFRPRADRDRPFKLASINTTETCNLSCVMCHFNGPNAIKKSGSLAPDQVLKALDNIPTGETVWFCATGEFFIDTNAVSYLRAATAKGLHPCVLTHGQMFTPELIDEVLKAGVRLIRMSVDTTDEAQYRKIRRGGELRNIIEACKTLRRKKMEEYPDLRVEINATLFRNTFPKQREMEDFWRGLVDQVNFNAEYFDTFSFRNTFFLPQKRVDCDLQLYIMPSGRIAPCCAIAVYQHDNDVSWLPHVDEVASLQDAHEALCDIYEDPNGPMASICSKCDWWILSMSGNSPYIRATDLNSQRNDA